jgi:NNP family nitrate/nitrite transporter-like MFS transporter
MSTKGVRSSGHLPTLIASLTHFDVSFMVWVLLGALGAYVADELGLGPAQKGLMVAVPPLGGAAFRLLLGSIADRFGTKRTGVVSMALTLVPLLWGWLAAGTFLQVLGIGLLLGVAGASFAVTLPLVSRWYPPEHQGLALGIAGAGNSGTIVAALAAPRLAEHVGWHGVFGLATIPVALAWLLFTTLAKEPAAQPVASSNPFKLLLEPDARWLCAFYLTTFGGFVGLTGYLPIYFHDRFALSKVGAAGFAALCAGAGSLVRPLGGAVADRLGGTRVLALILLFVSGAGAVLATLPPLSVTVVLLCATLGSLGIGNGAVFQIVPQRFPDRIGQITGLVGAAGGVGGFLLPFGLGALTELTGGFAVGFVLFAAGAGCASALVRHRQRVWQSGPVLEVAV